MSDYRRATTREIGRQWVRWVRSLLVAVQQTVYEGWKERPDGRIPVFITCQKCGNRCRPSQDGDCYFC